MKKLLQTTIWVNLLLIGILAVTPSCNYSQPKDTNGSKNTEKESAVAGVIALQGEAVLDLSKNPMDPYIADSLIKLCQLNVTNSLGKALPPVVDSIDTAAFEGLRNITYALRGTNTTDYVLALRIIYGLNSTNKNMRALYQPVFLKRSVNGSGKSNVEFIPVVQGIYYRYNYSSNPRAFESTTDLSSIKRYWSNIRINHTGTGPGPFDSTNDATGDVRSVVFPFQEIESLAIENNSLLIYVCNSVEYVNTTHLKHSLLLMPDDLQALHDSTFYKQFANLSHLCPPSCDTHKYDLK